jgi:hypothetical protein
LITPLSLADFPVAAFSGGRPRGRVEALHKGLDPLSVAGRRVATPDGQFLQDVEQPLGFRGDLSQLCDFGL